MLGDFERLARTYSKDLFFRFVDKDASIAEYTLEEARRHAATLAFFLQDKGVRRGSFVSVDMPNCPAFIFLILAAAYGGFTLVLLNHRLTEEEKSQRLLELKLMRNVDLATHITEEIAYRLLGKASFLFPEQEEPKKGMFGQKRGASIDPQERQLGEVLHWAEKGVAFFSDTAPAVVLFTSGTSGRPKAVPLTWANLRGSSEASNHVLDTYDSGMWQAALPLFHVGGLQIVMRSILSGVAFILYRQFDAARVLTDANYYGASHISVVDKMLQDLLGCKKNHLLKIYRCILLGGAIPNPITLDRACALGARIFISYGMTETSSHIASAQIKEGFDGSYQMLPGYEAQIVTPDDFGIGQLAVRGPGVFSNYLNARAAFTVDKFFLTGDTASLNEGRIVVEERVDDMFVSGGENIYPAEIRDKILRVPGISDVYVFGAEDETWGRRPVAMVERKSALSDAAENADPVSSESESAPAAVFDVSIAGRYATSGIIGGVRPDSSTGALGKKAEDKKESTLDSGISADNNASNQQFAFEVAKSLTDRLSKIHQPKHICAMDAFPRFGIGKTNQEALRQRYTERLEICEVKLYRIKQKFNEPIHTAKTTLKSRESIIVELRDWAGRSGLGECVSFPTDWYLPETLGQDERVLKDHLVPLVLDQVYLHPREVSACFNECEEATAFPMAKAALESAFWDLWGKITNKPLHQLLKEELAALHPCHSERSEQSERSRRIHALNLQVPNLATTKVPAGAVFGIMPTEKTLAAVEEAAKAGYTRVKLKIKPGDDIDRIRAVREKFPDLMIILDANQSYTERDLYALQDFDEFEICCIEEPLDPNRVPKVGPTDLFPRLARLQKKIKTPISLDESWANEAELTLALDYPELRSFVFKIGKLGGVAPALERYRQLQLQGVEVWMGGMHETGISKYLHAAFGTLSGITIPGDISSTSRYFATDITEPNFEARDGCVFLNHGAHSDGLGCELNREVLEQVLVACHSFTRET